MSINFNTFKISLLSFGCLSDFVKNGKSFMLSQDASNSKGPGENILWLFMHVAPIRNEKNSVVLYLCSFKDITSHKLPLDADLRGLGKFAKLARSVRSRQNTSSTPNGNAISPRDDHAAYFTTVNSRFLPQYRLEPPKTPAHIILHYSMFKAIWDWIILLFTFYTACMVPYNLAFKYKTMDDVPLLVMDSIVDVVFFVDIILNFHTTFVGPSGEVVSDAKTIRMNYLRTWFVVDLISCLPYDVFNAFQHQDDGISNLFSVLKVIRLLRLGRVARKLDHYLEYGAAVLVLIVCMFVLVSHWFACLWYHIGLSEVDTFPHNWLNSLANTTGKPYCDANGTRIENGGPTREAAYITSLYYTLSCMTSVGFGNVNATTEIEKLFSCCMMIAGSLLYAAIFGNVTNIFQQIMSANAKYHEMVNSVRDFMKLHCVPKELSERVTDYLVSTWVITKGIDTDKVLSYCPKDMKADISVHLNNQVFKNTPAFRLASDGCLRALAAHFKIFHTAPGDLFYHQGETLDQLSFIVSGSLEVIQDDEVIGLLSKGDIFGDTFWDTAHTIGQSAASVRALTYCNIHMIKKDKLLYVLSFYQAFANSFKRQIQLTMNLRDRWIFRKIEDIEREKQLEKERKSQPPLDFDKHPVKKILSKFKKNLQGSTNAAFDADKGSAQETSLSNGHIPMMNSKSTVKGGALFEVSPSPTRGYSSYQRRFSEIETELIQSLTGIRVELRKELESLANKLSLVDTRIETLLTKYDPNSSKLLLGEEMPIEEEETTPTSPVNNSTVKSLPSIKSNSSSPQKSKSRNNSAKLRSPKVSPLPNSESTQNSLPSKETETKSETVVEVTTENTTKQETVIEIPKDKEA